MLGLSSIVVEGKIAVILALDGMRRGGGDNGIGDDDYHAQGEAHALSKRLILPICR